jgi:hypothetical protein
MKVVTDRYEEMMEQQPQGQNAFKCYTAQPKSQYPPAQVCRSMGLNSCVLCTYFSTSITSQHLPLSKWSQLFTTLYAPYGTCRVSTTFFLSSLLLVTKHTARRPHATCQFILCSRLPHFISVLKCGTAHSQTIF